MYESRSDDAGCDSTGSEPAVGRGDAHVGRRRTGRPGSVVERLSRYGMQVMPSSFPRRSRLQRQLEVTDGEAPERGSLTPAMRKKYLKEQLLLSDPTHGASSEQDADWALYPMEHAWMLSAVEGSYDTLLEFISEHPCLLTRKDFISGYSVLHWLAKSGRDETLLQLLRDAQSAGLRVDVDVRGSGGLTPLHVASMHGQYMVVKLLVGAFSANVDAMDYNGKRAWQYLKGDAPLEMRELLGMWDEEHSVGTNGKQNVNNNSAGRVDLTACDEVDHGEAEVAVNSSDRTERGGGWRFGFLSRLLPSLSFLGNKC
ncbi:ankyrin repeat domain-containing protein SOWAHD [Anoplopoma fimbria]|uniref:ankyrin repeat domain-containing protein SOWAHD n=1 Tax=Anoplopoma fimbria TaxID=229290 RepID=UPI0023EACA18|nr:ankyrin repeat domain-containing protein SOWAHD [Anoplopoma fimbria]